MCYLYLSKETKKDMKKQEMTFTEILESEFYYLVEAIEHGSSDAEMLQQLKDELKDKTGYEWID